MSQVHSSVVFARMAAEQAVIERVEPAGYCHRCTLTPAEKAAAERLVLAGKLHRDTDYRNRVIYTATN